MRGNFGEGRSLLPTCTYNEVALRGLAVRVVP
jgi:hypothetical protein